MTSRLFAALTFLAAMTMTGQAGAAASDTAQLAQAAGSGTVRLSVEAACESGMAIFRVTNAGDEWPKSGRFAISKSGDEKLISDRSMRLTSGQQASFRVPVKKAGPGDYEISVQPSWYDRGKVVDARVSCK